VKPNKQGLIDCSLIYCFYAPMISVVIPVLNEQDNVARLLAEISQAAAYSPITDIVFVDDGSTDKTPAILSSLRVIESRLRVIRHKVRSGQSAALHTGIRLAKSQIIVTLDGDCQNDPADIRHLFSLFEEKGGKNYPLMIAGERAKRHDNIIRRFSSCLANKFRSWLLRDKTKDTGCSLKMFRREDYLSLPYFNHMHRFLPALMQREGVQVFHIDVSHRPRTSGVSKYGTLDRLLVGISDIYGVYWLMRRARPKTDITEEI
jgi:dolichol-phosphate mannosyltransferase